MKIFFRVAVPIIIAFYFPTFGKIIPLVKSIPYNFVKYSMIFISIFILFNWLKNKKWLNIDNRIFPLLIFNTFIMANFLIKGLIENLFQKSLNFSAGVILSTFFILFITQHWEFGRSDRLFNIITISLCFMLFLQIFFSSLESMTGSLLGEYEISRTSTGRTIIGGLGQRDFLNLVNLQIRNIFGFKIAFTGLIGTHNIFGIMLVFYNIFFLSQYNRTRKKYLICVFLLIIFGLICNGTRSALFVVVLTDILFFMYLHRKQLEFYGVFLISLSFLIFFMPNLINRIYSFYYMSDSISLRLILWGKLFSHQIFPRDFYGILFGRSINDIMLFGIKVGSVIKSSYESEFFSLLINNGIFGLILFLGVLSGFMYKSLHVRKKGTVTIRMLVPTIFFISFFMTGIIHYTAYILITLIILDYVHHNLIAERMNQVAR